MFRAKKLSEFFAVYLGFVNELCIFFVFLVIPQHQPNLFPVFKEILFQQRDDFIFKDGLNNQPADPNSSLLVA